MVIWYVHITPVHSLPQLLSTWRARVYQESGDYRHWSNGGIINDGGEIRNQ